MGQTEIPQVKSWTAPNLTPKSSCSTKLGVTACGCHATTLVVRSQVARWTFRYQNCFQYLFEPLLVDLVGPIQVGFGSEILKFLRAYEMAILSPSEGLISSTTNHFPRSTGPNDRWAKQYSNCHDPLLHAATMCQAHLAPARCRAGLTAEGCVRLPGHEVIYLSPRDQSTTPLTKPTRFIRRPTLI